MTINWDNVTVTDNSPELPDFDLCFELHDGWLEEDASPTEPCEPNESEDDYEDWVDPTPEDLDAIDAEELVWID
tara:strand:+ start:94 stop:315 length:222 start_codon:yes stop_codon:yes gene_type:complete